MVFKLYTLLIICIVVFANGHYVAKNQIITSTTHTSTRMLETESEQEYSDESSSKEDDIAPFSSSEQDGIVTSSIETTTIVENHDPVTESDVVRKCPEGQSSFIESDLNKMIDYFANQTNLIATLHDRYFDLATSLRDKEIKSLNGYLTKFENRPKHVDDLLDDLAQIRVETIEPLVNEVISKKPEFVLLQDKYVQQSESLKIHIKKFEKSKQICTLNCGATELETHTIRKRSTLSSEGNYYCSTIEEVKHKILTVLSQFVNEYAETLENTVLEIHGLYEKNIEDLKLKLKEAAVQEFGATMYDVLSLEDEYNHFLNLLRGEKGINNGVESQLNEIRKNNLQIDYKIEELKNDLEKYRRYCLSCDGNQNLRLQRYAVQKLLPQIEPANDVLDNLLNTYLIEVKSNTDTELANIFIDINKIISDQDAFVQVALTKLQPVKDEIKENLEKEERELNNLKTQEPESLMEELSKLNEDSTNLINTLDEVLTFIHEYIRR